MKNYFTLVSFLLIFVFGGLLAGCQSSNAVNSNNAAPTKKIVIGVSPGPYGDMIRYAIKPGLEKKGYSVEIKEFSDWVQPNLALSNKELDANEMDEFIKRNNELLSKVIML